MISSILSEVFLLAIPDYFFIKILQITHYPKLLNSFTMPSKWSRSTISKSCFKFNLDINLYPVKKNLSTLLFILLKPLFNKLLYSNKQFFSPQTTKFEKSNNLFCLVPLTIELLVPSIFPTTDATRFHSFLYEVESGNILLPLTILPHGFSGSTFHYTTILCSHPWSGPNFVLRKKHEFLCLVASRLKIYTSKLDGALSIPLKITS